MNPTTNQPDHNPTNSRRAYCRARLTPFGRKLLVDRIVLIVSGAV